MCLIAGSAMGSLILIYSGLFRVIMRQFEIGGIVTTSGIALAGACWVMCKHSDDLIDRRG